jgi:two-component system sensor histidine kinase HydH
MQKQSRQHRLLMGIPPWILLGAVLVLFPIFAFIAVENIHRQKEQGTRLLLEKGAALIRSFEAGARTGMGMGWNNFRLQTLLFETAQQPDIDYIIVADTLGTILAHNRQDRIGSVHGGDLDLKGVSESEAVHWRIVAEPTGHKTFEVYRKFVPASGMGMQHGQMMGMMGRMMGRRWQQRQMEHKDGRTHTEPEALNIFVGLDMTAIEAAREADTRHFLLMVFILLLIGFSGIILLFFFQSYRATKASLSRIKAFSDTLVENMPIGLIAVDKQRRVASMNYVAGSVLGLSETDVTGSDVGHSLPVQFQHQLDAVEKEGRLDEREIEITDNDGRLIPLEISGTTLNDENGESLGYVFLFKDLTEVKALRDEVPPISRKDTGMFRKISRPPGL